MSVESLAIVLHHSRAKGTAKLVAIGIANHDGDGGAWPTIATLAKYANVSTRNARKAVAQLVSLGEIRVGLQEGGTHDLEDFERPNRYELLIACPPYCDRTTHHRDTRRWHGRQRSLPGVHPVDNSRVTPGRIRQGGSDATGGGGSDATPKPPIEPEPNPVSASTTEGQPRPKPATPPPIDELAKVREQLRTASNEHARRANRV